MHTADFSMYANDGGRHEKNSHKGDERLNRHVDNSSVTTTGESTDNPIQHTSYFEMSSRVQQQLSYRSSPKSKEKAIDTELQCGAADTKCSSSSPSCVSGGGGGSSNIRLFGFDLSNLKASTQFYTCASGVFVFTVVYGYLQETISMHVAGRRFAMFLSTVQFFGYAFWSFVLMKLHAYSNAKDKAPSLSLGTITTTTTTRNTNKGHEYEPLVGQQLMVTPPSSPAKLEFDAEDASNEAETPGTDSKEIKSKRTRPSLRFYILLSTIRAIDVGMTNGAMRYINYPMKTLIKSSRVAFTMIGGMVIGKKRYSRDDYVMVSMLVFGLCFFIHADMNSDAAFNPLGLAMLTVSLLCDGAVQNYSELAMTQHEISQDEFQFRVYSISFVAMLAATFMHGELSTGFQYFFLRDGTIPEIIDNIATVRTLRPGKDGVSWTIDKKIMILILFTFTGLCGSSSAGAITKRFGALSMSVVGTTRKAFTLFISFAAFRSNRCTAEHLLGMVVFVSALFLKSIRALIEEKRRDASPEAVETSMYDEEEKLMANENEMTGCELELHAVSRRRKHAI